MRWSVARKLAIFTIIVWLIGLATMISYTDRLEMKAEYRQGVAVNVNEREPSSLGIIDAFIAGVRRYSSPSTSPEEWDDAASPPHSSKKSAVEGETGGAQEKAQLESVSHLYIPEPVPSPLRARWDAPPLGLGTEFTPQSQLVPDILDRVSHRTLQNASGGTKSPSARRGTVPPADESFEDELWSLFHPTPAGSLELLKQREAGYGRAFEHDERLAKLVKEVLPSLPSGAMLMTTDGATGHTMRSIAQKRADSLLVVAEAEPLRSRTTAARAVHWSLSNVVVCERELSLSLAEDLFFYSSAMFRVQLLSNMSRPMSALLPHEFERVLGAHLSMAQTTLLAFDRSDETAQYLEYWSGSVTKLVEASARALGLAVLLEREGTNESWRLYRVDLMEQFERSTTVCAESEWGHDGCQRTLEHVLEYDGPPIPEEDEDEDEDEDEHRDDHDDEEEEEEEFEAVVLLRPLVPSVSGNESALAVEATPLSWSHVPLQVLLLLDPTPTHRQRIVAALAHIDLPSRVASPRVLPHHVRADADGFSLEIIEGALEERNLQDSAMQLGASRTMDVILAREEESRSPPTLLGLTTRAATWQKAPGRENSAAESKDKDKRPPKDQDKPKANDAVSENKSEYDAPGGMESLWSLFGAVKDEPEAQEKLAGNLALEEHDQSDHLADKVKEKLLELEAEHVAAEKAAAADPTPSEEREGVDANQEDAVDDFEQFMIAMKLKQQKEMEMGEGKEKHESDPLARKLLEWGASSWSAPPWSPSWEPSGGRSSTPSGINEFSQVFDDATARRSIGADLDVYDRVWQSIVSSLDEEERGEGRFTAARGTEARGAGRTLLKPGGGSDVGVLGSEVSTVSKKRALWLVHNSGHGFLTMKLARRYPLGAVVSVEESSLALERQRSLSRALGVRNVHFCQSAFALSTMLRLEESPQAFRYQVIPRSFASLMLSATSEHDALYSTGLLLAHSATSFLELPALQSLRLSLPLLQYSGSESAGLRMLERAMQSVGLDLEGPLHFDTEESLLHTSAAVIGSLLDEAAQTVGLSITWQRHGKVLRVNLAERALRVLSLPSRHREIVQIGTHVDGVMTAIGRSGSESVLPVDTADVNVQTLLFFGLEPHARLDLMHAFISLQQHDCQAPWNMFVLSPHSRSDWSDRSSRATSKVQIAFVALDAADSRPLGVDPTDLRSLVLADDTFHTNSFSFLEHNSGEGTLSMDIARKYPHSTVVSLERSEAAVRRHRRAAGENGTRLFNNAICHQDPDATFLNVLSNSPELFQYQWYSNVLGRLGAESSRTDFKSYMGKLLTVSQTTFFDVPTAAMLSLARSIFRPGLSACEVGDEAYYENVPEAALLEHECERVDASYMSQSFYLSDNPMPDSPFQDTAIQLLQNFVQRSTLYEIEVRHLETFDSTREFVRVDSVNFTRSVGHHFIRSRDQWKDQHSRRYTMRNSGRSTVLEREEDGSLITYDRFGISLIALLRMGTSDWFRDRMFAQYVKLPLYLDMAPWNLQFNAGQLAYVDKDTMEDTFDHLTPYAYQLMLAMINYKRTLEDLHKCPSEGQVQYNVPLVGICASKNVVLPKGVLCDEDNPVPCADGQCHPSFLECLRTVVDMEGATRRWLADDKSEYEDTASHKTVVHVR